MCPDEGNDIRLEWKFADFPHDWGGGGGDFEQCFFFFKFSPPQLGKNIPFLTPFLFSKVG